MDNKENIISDYKNGMRLCDLSVKYDRPTSNLIEMLKRERVFAYKNKRWSKEELSTLKSLYPDGSWDTLLSKLHRWTKDEIVHKASTLKIKRNSYYWNANDIEILVSGYNSHTPASEIRVRLSEKFSVESIYRKANELGLSMRAKWDDESISRLIENYENKTPDEIRSIFSDRSYSCVKTYAHKNHLVSKYWREKVYSRASHKSLSHYIRSNNLRWKTDAMERCEYKCVLSGQRFDAIHHLQSCDLLLQETIDRYSIDIKPFEDYTNDELLEILQKFLTVQSEYPPGVCLSLTHHRNFHNLYGYGGNTPEQFAEYASHYKIP